MPDIKHHFAGGKMNKDVDERLVPNGEYRHAINVQVSTSENSEVGTVQNILGNERLYDVGQINIGANASCIGTVSDEKDDAFYWFISEEGLPDFFAGNYTNGFFESKDMILRHKNNLVEYVFVDLKELYVLINLGSQMNPITGDVFISTTEAFDKIEVGDKILFWEDVNTGERWDDWQAEVVSKDATNNSINIGGFLNANIVGALPGQPMLSMSVGKTREKVLEFNTQRIITGINIIDDMLFWTDGFSEPKKINITRSVQGTEQTGLKNTVTVNLKLQNPLGLIANNPNVIGISERFVTKQEITVIKRSPKIKLNMDLVTTRDFDQNYSGVMLISSPGNANQSTFVGNSSANGIYDFSTISVGDTFYVSMPYDSNNNSSFVLNGWEVGKTVVLKPETITGALPTVPLQDWAIRGTIEDWSGNNFDTANGIVQVKIKIVTDNDANPVVAGQTFQYVIDLLDEEEKLFEFKFPRFSYRYKYEDGEYSTFAPFTQVAFSPGSFSYHPKRGFNLGMTNQVKEIKLSGWKTIIEQINVDVVAIDILYKEEDNPNIYVVETIDPKDYFVPGDLNAYLKDEYFITSETIKGVLPSNQLLRSWDNVPKRALAQDVVGNRIVYGNYYQNFSLLNKGTDQQHNPKFRVLLSNTYSENRKSIKSLRDYQLGVVFLDEHGRETPIITNTTAGITVSKKESVHANSLLVSTVSQATPVDAKYFKFYIKETSTEYYNLAMDRYYDAKDDNIWLSFNSNDRSKLDIDDYLILKKAAEKNYLVEQEARYKILAIENEAPDFIKTHKTTINTQVHHNTNNNIINSSNLLPTQEQKTFELAFDTAYNNSNIRELHTLVTQATKDVKYYISFRSSDNSVPATIPLEITSVAPNNQDLSSATKWTISVDKPFDSTINNFTNDPTGNNVNDFNNGTIIVFYKYEVKNLPEFDGRFFVKIYNDDIFQQNIVNTGTSINVNYNIVAAQKIFSFKKEAHDKTWDMGDNCPTDASAAGIPNYWHVQAYSSSSNIVNEDYGGSQGYLQTLDNSAKDAGVGGFITNSHRQWRPHAAFMRGRNTIRSRNHGEVIYDTANNLSYNGAPGIMGINRRVTTLDPHDPATPFDFQDVWFIDDAGHIENTFVYGFGGSNDGWDGKPAGGSSSSVGIINSPGGAVLDLNFGGLQRFTDAELSNGWIVDDEDTNDPIIYDLENNELYSGNVWNIAKRLVAGQKIRFAEDPTGEVYEITGVENAFLARYCDNNGTPLEGSKDTNWEQQRGYLVGGKVMATGATLTYTYNNIRYDNQIYFRPFNFTRRFRITLDKELVWNPGGYNDPISGGVELTLTASSSFANNTVTLSSLQGNSNYGTRTLTEGMVLKSINGTAVPDDRLVVVADISSTSNTVYFKKYRTDLSNVDVSGLSISNNDTLVFAQYSFNGISPNSVLNINYHNDAEGFNATKMGVDSVGYTIEFLEEEIEESVMPTNPAIWETEPKDQTDLDIYYEASDNIPIELSYKERQINFPVGSTIENYDDPGLGIFAFGGFGQPQIISTTPSASVGSTGSQVVVFPAVCTTPGGCLDPNTGVQHTQITAGTKILIHKPNGSKIIMTLAEDAVDTPPPLSASILTFENNVYQNSINILDWHNCYSWGNGVESNRIRDNFNLQFITNGVVASSTIDNVYEEEHRKYGLIYSGIYNDNSNTNETNQFVAAEKITKDINPIYGSIQKIHTRDTDLVVLCEDKVLKILANKDAVFNADGNPQLTANERVLGQAVPFVGEYGISKNPESFASESYRVYFTDKVRGTVMRLSMDGLTPISNHGMKDWFRDNLKLSSKVLGSYDDKKDEYNLTLDNSVDGMPKTLSFREDVKGWVSFKSFIPEIAVSCANEYYTWRNGEPWLHHVERFDANGVEFGRNTFYDNFTNSEVSVIINEIPGSVKSFTTINYEGSDAKITQNLDDDQYYNLDPRKGWYVDKIETNKEVGDINEFIEKEGKWFNFIKGKEVQVTYDNNNLNNSGHIFVNPDGSSYFDQASFAIQGQGVLSSTPIVITTTGCTDSTAFNYDPNATVDDGSCEPILMGCLDPSATNYYPSANTDDATCEWWGCTCDPQTYPDGCTNTTVFPPQSYNNNDDGSCIGVIYGCTDPNAVNYNPSANTDDGSCMYTVTGCTIGTASNFDPLANTDDGTCIWYGCTDNSASNPTTFPPEALSYTPLSGSYGILDDGSCVFTYGCTDPTAQNYDPTASTDDGSCFYCDEITTPIPVGGPSQPYNGIPFTIVGQDETFSGNNDGQIAVVWNTDYFYLQGSGVVAIGISGNGVMQSATFGYYLNNSPQSNSALYDNLPPGTYTITTQLTNTPGYNATPPNPCPPFTYTVTIGTGGPLPVLGCTDPVACNYDSGANTDDGSCEYVTCLGCTDVSADNYNIQTNSIYQPQPFCTLGGVTANCRLDCNGDDINDPSYVQQSGWDSCCTYTIYGCTDPAANNYDPLANTDDGSCDYCVYGCIDSGATNYDPNATCDDGSCVYPQPTQGCTDPTACNYDAAAGLDCLGNNINAGGYTQIVGWDNCCYKGFSDIYVGSPNGPMHYLPGTPSPSDTEQHFLFDPGVAGPGGDIWDPSTAPAGTPQLALGYDLDSSAGVVDLGLSYRMLNTNFTSSSDSVRVRLWKRDSAAVWNPVYNAILSNAQAIAVFPFNGIYGNRSEQHYPHPWGNAQNSSTNYEFNIYHPITQSGPQTTWTKAEYAVELYYEIDGGYYGRRDAVTNLPIAAEFPNCGGYLEFQFTVDGCLNDPTAVLGCTDPSACNHDYNATCDDGSCYYVTVQAYESLQPGVTGCTACSIPNSNPGSACQQSIPDCTYANDQIYLQYGINNYLATTNVLGGIYDDITLCNSEQGSS